MPGEYSIRAGMCTKGNEVGLAPVYCVKCPSVGQEGGSNERIADEALDHCLVRADRRLPPDKLPRQAPHKLIRSL